MRLRTVMVLVAIGVAVWTAPLAGVRATRGAHTTADEPQYLLSAISIGEDRSLDIADERRAGRYRDFHEAALPLQEVTQRDGSRISPHDPLLPLLLAAPMRAGGWVAAKLTLAAVAGGLAALLVWAAVRRFEVPVRTAVIGVLAFSLSAPLAIYATQVYPELLAAVAVAAGIAALTGPLARGGLLVLAGGVVALPWLSVKYTPVAAVLAGLALWQLLRSGRRSTAAALAGGLAVAGLAYVVAHHAWYGGWTVYAAGDHFVGGETTVIGYAPNYPGRAIRLVGLLADRGFGLVVWSPVYLLAVPAFAALARAATTAAPAGGTGRGPVADRSGLPHAAVLGAVLIVGWLNATFVALTMHGWWWPGRQLVVVLPAVVLGVTWWAAQSALARHLVTGGLVLGAATYLWLLVEGLRERLTLVVDFERTTAPAVRALRALTPDLRLRPPGTTALVVAWTVGLLALACWGWTRAASRARPVAPLTSEPQRKEGPSWARPFA